MIVFDFFFFVAKFMSRIPHSNLVQICAQFLHRHESSSVFTSIPVKYARSMLYCFTSRSAVSICLFTTSSFTIRSFTSILQCRVLQIIPIYSISCWFCMMHQSLSATPSNFLQCCDFLSPFQVSASLLLCLSCKAYVTFFLQL
jgi:hypothetical protein